MKKLIIAAMAVVLLAAAVLYFMPKPAQPQDGTPPTYTANASQSVEVNDKNSVVYSLLVAAGIKDAFVDASGEKAVIAFEIPKNVSSEASVYYALGAAASVLQTSKEITVKVFEDGKQKIQATAQTKDVKDFINGNLTEEQMKARLALTT